MIDIVKPRMNRPDSKIWESKNGKQFEESHCEDCETVSITCPVCGIASCAEEEYWISGKRLSKDEVCIYHIESFEEYLNG